MEADQHSNKWQPRSTEGQEGAGDKAYLSRVHPPLTTCFLELEPSPTSRHLPIMSSRYKFIKILSLCWVRALQDPITLIRLSAGNQALST
jgi:hypothetical protein